MNTDIYIIPTITLITLAIFSFIELSCTVLFNNYKKDVNPSWINAPIFNKRIPERFLSARYPLPILDITRKHI